MSHPNSIPIAAASVRCPKCEGRGQARYARPGGWISEVCTPCRGGGRLDPETAETVRRLMDAGDAALGPAEGRCCTPEEGHDPCVACDVPDDEPYVLTAEDEEFYREWCRDREEAARADRIARHAADLRLGQQVEEAMRAVTFQQMLADLANAFTDHPDPDLEGIGRAFAEWYDESRAVEARSWDQYQDRKAAVTDSRY